MNCALCGHVKDFAACGSGTAFDRSFGGPVKPRELYLCHTDSHSCYHRWTVYGDRPQDRREEVQR